MIWILPYDPFGDERMIYTIKNMVEENPKLVYNDCVEKLFVYTKGIKGGSKKLKEFLTYLEETIPVNAVDKELQEMQTIVGKVKHKKEVGERYMTLQEIINHEKQWSYEDGVEDGKESGFLSGKESGIISAIRIMKDLNASRKYACESLCEKFELTKEQAEEYLELHW